MKNAMVLRFAGPPLSRHSCRNVKTLATIVLSLGPVRKNHLNPFSVSVGDAQGWHVIGRPALSTTGWMSEVMPLVPSPLIQWTLLTEINCSTIVRACSPRLWSSRTMNLMGAPPSPAKPLPGPSGTWRSG